MYSAKLPKATIDALLTFIIAVLTVTTAWPASESSSDSSPSSSSLRGADASIAASQIEIRTLVSAPLVAVVPFVQERRIEAAALVILILRKIEGRRVFSSGHIQQMRD